MQQTRLSVEAMCCVEEVRAVERVLQTVQGVQEVRPNLLSRTVLVVHDPNLTSSGDLIQAVNRTGMKATASEAPQESLSSKNWHLRLTALSGVCVAAGLILHWTEISETLGKVIFLLAVVWSGWFIAPKAWSALKRLSPDMNLLTILQSASPSEVSGIDPSEEYIPYARTLLPQDRCHLLVADARALPHEFSDFDATVSSLALNLVPEPMAAPAEMIRVTRHD